jgi:DtxR family Mn-dependent transcriptional regulator
MPMSVSHRTAMSNRKQDVLHTLRTEAVEDFLKTVYKLERQQIPVPTSLLANTLGIKPPSVTEMAKKLADSGLLEYEKYKGLRLTEPGRRIALEVIRHHRLIEMYLTEALGYTWDEVHAEADRLEHVISEQFEARIAEALGHPVHDPHGDPIPRADGTVPYQELVSVADAPLNKPCIVHRIIDQSSDMLRYLSDIGLVPGAHVLVRSRDPFDGPIHLQVEGQSSVIAAAVSRQILLITEAG